MNLGSALIVVLVGILFFLIMFTYMAYKIIDKIENQDVFQQNQSQVSDKVRDKIIKEITETNNAVFEIKKGLNLTN